jgi:aspartate dehydrogenase
VRSIGLIGCGAIGLEIARALDSGRINGRLDIVFDLYKDNAYNLVNVMRSYKPKVAESMDDLLRSDTDLIVEAASQQAVKDYARRVIEHGKDIMIMSIGALLEDELYNELIMLVQRHNRRIYLPSGAVAGIDAIKSVKHMLKEVMLITTKHPRALRGAPFFDNKGIDVMSIKHKEIIYEGNAREAVKLFPANVNVAAVLSIAGIGADKTRVRIVADPSIDRNMHEIIARGEFGELHIMVSNIPSPNNPKTSYLAVLSAIECLREACDDSITIGT